jgi:hypothetical protein
MSTETNQTAAPAASAQPDGNTAAPAAAPAKEGVAAAAAPVKEGESAAVTPPAEKVEDKSAEKAQEKGKEGEPAAGAPEKYELTLSEQSPLPAARIDEIAAEAKELGLSNDDAQKLLAREEKAVADDRAREAARVASLKSTWIEEVKNDPEMGGENANKTAELSSRFVEKHASPKLKAILDSTGMGNFPEFVRLMAKGGALMGEGEIVPSGGGGGSNELSKDQLHAQTLFGGKSKQ